MLMKNPDPDARIDYSSQEKVSILKAQLVDGLPVAEVCQKYHISVADFHHWQRIFFEGAAQLFERRPNASNVRRQEAAAQKKVEELEAKLVRKDEVIAELLFERMQLRQATGQWP